MIHVPCINHLHNTHGKDQQMHLIYVCNFIEWWSPTCYGSLCGYFHGGENKNTNIVMCRNRSTVLKVKIVLNCGVISSHIIIFLFLFLPP